MRYILDTNILLFFVRGKAKGKELKELFDLDNPAIEVFYSIASWAELFSLVKQFNWSEKKIDTIEGLLSNFVRIEIDERIAKTYIEIDVYSQGKDKLKPLPKGVSSRNMGKNDLSIAATVTILNATLLTTDDDFSHLNGVFINSIQIEH